MCVTALVAGSLASAAVGAGGDKSAAKTQKQAADESNALQREIYEDTRDRLQPFEEAGKDAWSSYLFEMGLGDRPEGYGGYTQSPMASYMMEEGADSIDAAFAARGGYNSGAALEALEANRRAVISADTDSYFNRLRDASGIGLNAAGNVANAGQAYAGAVGANNMNAATNIGNAQMAAAQQWQTGIGDMAGIYGYFGPQGPMAAYAQPTLSTNLTSSIRPMARPF